MRIRNKHSQLRWETPFELAMLCFLTICLFLHTDTYAVTVALSVVSVASSASGSSTY